MVLGLILAIHLLFPFPIAYLFPFNETSTSTTPKNQVMSSHGKRSSKKESKTEKLNRLGQEWREIQEKIDQNDAVINNLETQYQIDADGRWAYKKSTYGQLSAAYDKRERYGADLQAIKVEYAATEAEIEYSSGEESMKSTGSRSSGCYSGSSKSSAPAIIGWDCGRCQRPNFTDPWGLENRCGCGHQFCETDDCCAVQWNPDSA